MKVNIMKKLLMATAAALILCSSAVRADEIQDAADEAHIPLKYLEINQNCENNDIYKYNDCLKTALFKIVDESFTEEQIKDLKGQLDGIEQQVDTAELDYNDPKVKEIENDPAKIKEFRAQNMNLIWKRLIIETLNSLKNAMEAAEI